MYGNWPTFHRYLKCPLSLTLTKIYGQSHLPQLVKDRRELCYREGSEAHGAIPYWSRSIWLYPGLFHYFRASTTFTTEGTGATVRTALLDFFKAFNLVDHNILVGKLRTLRVKPTSINWIIDFLRDRKQRVKLYGAYSEWLNVSARVPQGTRFGPWLFLVLKNDLRVTWFVVCYVGIRRWHHCFRNSTTIQTKRTSASCRFYQHLVSG